MGSILGAAYASGAPLARIIATCKTLRFRDIARWRVSRLGLASNQRLGDLIERVFDSRQFEDLRIPMAVVATDLNTGEPVVLSHGNPGGRDSRQLRFSGLVRARRIRHPMSGRWRLGRTGADPSRPGTGRGICAWRLRGHSRCASRVRLPTCFR